MGDYLKLFEKHSEYETYSGGEMLKPNVSYCRQENEVHYNPWTWADTYLTFVAKESGTFTFTPQSSNTINYSTDNGENWTVGNSVTVDSGDKVLWKGTMTPSGSGIGNFSSTANFGVQGNVMSLLFGDDFKGKVDLTGKNYAFYRLFYNNAKVVSAENLSLPATTLAGNCYNGMFRGCTSLVTAPELSATTLVYSCYNSMFQGCTELATAPELPATGLADSCYMSMFQGCTKLATAPELPARWLGGEGNYVNMFRDCTSLTTAPSILPATSLVSGCYYAMFYGCTKLTTAPVLPATTLADQCYGEMFSGCTSLNYIKAMFTTTPSSTYTSDWVNGVASSGTFVKNSAATWNVTGTNGVPSGWTVETASA